MFTTTVITVLAARSLGGGNTEKRTVLGQRGLETLVYRDGETRAYASLSRESQERSVLEFGGDEAALRALFAFCFEWYDLESLTAYVHPSHSRNDLFVDVSAGWRNRTPRMLSVRNLPALLRGFSEQLERRWDRRPLALEGELRLRIEGADVGVRLSYGPDGVSVDPDDGRPDHLLDRRVATRLLFGSEGRAVSLRREHPVLESLLPLDYYIWHTEYV